MHQMFQNEELWFTFSNNDAEVENKIYRNIFDTTARAAVPAYGSVQNSHYLGIPKQSSRKAAAMVVINFLISPEAQLEKSKTEVWGDGPVISMDQLTDKQQQLFEKAMQRTYAPERSSIDSLALQELDPQYMIRLYEDFQNYMEGKLDY
jgi:putative spermidine/putrescine transport system substrate-binding protein